MNTAKLPNRGLTRIKFFATYILSVALILVLLSSFLKASSIRSEPAFVSSAVTPSKTDANFAADERLHGQMQKLQNTCVQYALKAGSKEAADSLQQESTSFGQVTDSIRTTNASLPADEKQKLQTLLDAFSREAEKQVSLAKSFSSVRHDTVTMAGGSSSAQMDELKSTLAQKEQKILELTNQNQTALQNKDKATATALQEKDRTIAALQAKLNTQQTTMTKPVTNTGGAEWKDKYEKLKLTYDKQKEINDKYVSQSNSLKTAYKEVVDDNRRLIAQLQQARGAKN